MLFVDDIKKYKEEIEELIEYENKDHLTEKEAERFKKLKKNLSKKMGISKLKYSIIKWLEKFSLDEIKQKFSHRIIKKFKPNTYKKFTLGRKTVTYSFVKDKVYYTIYLPKYEIVKAFLQKISREG